MPGFDRAFFMSDAMRAWSFFRFDSIETELSILDLTRFLYANRCPLRSKTL